MRDINVAVTGTLNALAQTITFNTAIDKNKLLTIVNTTANVEIYTANDATNGGVLSGGNLVLTLDYDTTAMNDADLIQVIYEGAASTALASQATLASILAALAATPLPTGAATSANQATEIAALAAILAKIITAPSTEAKQDAQIAQMVTMLAKDLALGGGKNLADIITALTDGSVVITDIAAILAQLQATLAVTQSGTWTVQPGNTANTTRWLVDSLPSKASAANTPSILTSGGDVIASNASRKSWGIQNLGTSPLFVRMATGASSSVFHFCLGPGSASDDGLGASVSDDIYTGVVSATGTSPRFTVYEL